MKVEITKIDESALNDLQKISRSTFEETYAWYNTPKNMDFYLSVNFGETQLRRELNSKDCHFYLLRVNQEVAGYIKLNTGEAQTDNKLPSSVEVERIYVSSSFKSKGLGKLLMHQAFHFAKESNIETVWLGVWEHNAAAKEFYERLGFEVFGEHNFYLGDDKQLDYMLKKSVK